MSLSGNLLRGQIPYAISPNDVAGDTSFTYTPASGLMAVPALNVAGAITLALPPTITAPGPNEIQITTTNLTALQILALFTTAVSIVPAPAAGYLNDLISCTIIYQYVTAYTIGSATNLAVKHTDKNGSSASGVVAVTGFLDLTANAVVQLKPLSVLAVSAAALTISLAGANPTGGTSTIKIYTAYRVVPVT